MDCNCLLNVNERINKNNSGDSVMNSKLVHLVQVPGFFMPLSSTGVVLFIYDGNGMINYLDTCRHKKHTENIL